MRILTITASAALPHSFLVGSAGGSSIRLLFLVAVLCGWKKVDSTTTSAFHHHDGLEAQLRQFHRRLVQGTKNSDSSSHDNLASYLHHHQQQQQQQQQKQQQQQQQQQTSTSLSPKAPKNQRRVLQEVPTFVPVQDRPLRPCNQLISTVSIADITGIGTLYATLLLGESSPFVGAVSGQIQGLAQYPVQVWKVCGSCASVAADAAAQQEEQEQPAEFGTFARYCGEAFYGSDAQLSALVMIPIADPETKNQVPPTGTLRGFVNPHTTESSLYRAPTQVFASNTTAELEALSTADNPSLATLLFVSDRIDTMVPLLAAASGAVGIVPDDVGFGESSRTHNRTYFYHESYMQGAIVSWFTAQQWLKQYTAGCSLLSSDAVTLAGTSSGGYAAISAATAFRKLNVNVLTTFCLAPSFIPEQVIASIVEAFDTYNETTDMMDVFSVGRRGLPFSIFSSSIEVPLLPNTGTGQKTVNPAWAVPGNASRNLLSWYATPDAVSTQVIEFQLTPPYLPEILEPSLLKMYQTAADNDIVSPCSPSAGLVTPGLNDKTCEFVQSVSTLDLVTQTDHPVVICSSPNDTVANVRQIPPSLFTTNPLVRQFPGLLGIPVTGDHYAASLGCLLAPTAALLDGSVGITTIVPLAGSNLQTCQASSAAAADGNGTTTTGTNDTTTPAPPPPPPPAPTPPAPPPAPVDPMPPPSPATTTTSPTTLMPTPTGDEDSSSSTVPTTIMAGAVLAAASLSMIAAWL